MKQTLVQDVDNEKSLTTNVISTTGNHGHNIATTGLMTTPLEGRVVSIDILSR